MGDLIDITTWPKHQKLFYPVTGNGITFEVKAVGPAVLGLSRKPSHNVEVWVGIGSHNCWIGKHINDCQDVQFETNMSNEHFTGFWLLWSGSSIKLGKLGVRKPIVDCQSNRFYNLPLKDLKYITFTVTRGMYPVHWRFESSPLTLKAPSEKIFDDDLQWKDLIIEEHNGNRIKVLPEGAMIGGFENEPIYIARAHLFGSLCVGKYLPSKGSSFFPWGGDEHQMEKCEILCGMNAKWKSTHGDHIPENAFIGGYSEVHREPLYVGRAMHENFLLVGKVQPSHSSCYLPYRGKEKNAGSYDILVRPDAECRGIFALQYDEEVDSE